MNIVNRIMCMAGKGRVGGREGREGWEGRTERRREGRREGEREGEGLVPMES